MPVIVSCSCKARVRVPDEHLGRTVRCPRCQAEFVALAEQQKLSTQAAGPADLVGQTCPICLGTIQAGEAATACPACAQAHHQDCWAEVGGCSTYGCPQAPAVEKKEGAGQPLTAWGDTKQCPVCKETIKSIALRCRYCNAEFDTVDPLSIKDLRKKADKDDTLKGIRQGVWALFVLSLIGCLGPLVLIFGGTWFALNRKKIAKAGPLYTTLGYTAVAIAAFWTILLVGFIGYEVLNSSGGGGGRRRR